MQGRPRAPGGARAPLATASMAQEDQGEECTEYEHMITYAHIGRARCRDARARQGGPLKPLAPVCIPLDGAQGQQTNPVLPTDNAYLHHIRLLWKRHFDELEYTPDWPVRCELQVHHTSLRRLYRVGQRFRPEIVYFVVKPVSPGLRSTKATEAEAQGHQGQGHRSRGHQARNHRSRGHRSRGH